MCLSVFSGIVTSFCAVRSKLLAFRLSPIPGDKDLGHRDRIFFFFVLLDKESQG